MDYGFFLVIVSLMLGAIIALLIAIGKMLESSNKLLSSINASLDK